MSLTYDAAAAVTAVVFIVTSQSFGLNWLWYSYPPTMYLVQIDKEYGAADLSLKSDFHRLSRYQI